MSKNVSTNICRKIAKNYTILYINILLYKYILLTLYLYLIQIIDESRPLKLDVVAS